MNDSIFLALDFPTWQQSDLFLKQNELKGVPVKVGMELFYREGPAVIEHLKENNHPIFLDLKLHDIPTTVKKAMKNIAALDVDIVNIHALGGKKMIQSAKEGLLIGAKSKQPKLIAVTILTSMDQQTMNVELGIPGKVEDQVVHYARVAQNNGADGVVCSIHEVLPIKEVCTPSFLTVTPGIRLNSSYSNDQKRTSTPKKARGNGSDIIVIGRSVTQADNPRQAYLQVVKEWEEGR
ncbi:orotidine-5'-phosphate decarboxylase [Oceanobacillus limi]|uniref:Orotidine 5'-phosphate decarboxylase n=1 Tax=Oceanobacillus limi TaxID=930131 RepID=A0A1I0DF14_9BACI|nr:orotidine-5'-phosphate decarboxylase [Oceanobacillus limi]SET30972.1 orotidine-5'-phosphate decarboxylase [Oceanobacillus limi]